MATSSHKANQASTDLNPLKTSKHTLLVSLIALATIVFGCGDEEAKPKTLKDRLEDIAGEELTDEQVSDSLKKAELICNLDEEIQENIWDNLESKDMEFQDFVFEFRCPEKLEFYRDRTGRL